MNKANYKAVFDQVDSKISKQHFLCLIRKNTVKRPRLGLIIAKKQVKLAVQRNRIKRIVRDSFRCHQNTMPAVDIIFLSRNGLGSIDNPAIHFQLKQVWQRVIKQYNHSQH